MSPPHPPSRPAGRRAANFGLRGPGAAGVFGRRDPGGAAPGRGGWRGFGGAGARARAREAGGHNWVGPGGLGTPSSRRRCGGRGGTAGRPPRELPRPRGMGPERSGAEPPPRGAGGRAGRAAVQRGRQSALQSHAGRSEASERLSNFAQLAPQLRSQSPAPRAARRCLARPKRCESSPRRPEAPRPARPPPPPAGSVSAPPRPRGAGPTCALSTGAQPWARGPRSRCGGGGGGGVEPRSGRVRQAGGAVPAAELLRVAGPPCEEAALVTPAAAGGSAWAAGRAGPGGARVGLGRASGADSGGTGRGLPAGAGERRGEAGGSGARVSEVLPYPPRPPGLAGAWTSHQRVQSAASPAGRRRGSPRPPLQGTGNPNVFPEGPTGSESGWGWGLPAGH